jgi:hypothetical protein
MAEKWLLEGEWYKNCNCDPGCPCDFNQPPTHANCEGMIAMRIDKGAIDGVDVSGLCWAMNLYWPGRMDEGNGTSQTILDERADERQRAALLDALSGGGDTMMEIVAAVCPNVAEPVSAPFEWQFDLDNRRGRMRAGAYLETEVETLRGFGDPPPPYRIQVTIPNGFEYTGPDERAETAVATTLRTSGAVAHEHSNCHSSMARVRRGRGIGSGAEAVISETTSP